MKTRKGFVSNSSSTNFIVAMPKFNVISKEFLKLLLFENNNKIIDENTEEWHDVNILLDRIYNDIMIKIISKENGLNYLENFYISLTNQYKRYKNNKSDYLYYPLSINRCLNKNELLYSIENKIDIIEENEIDIFKFIHKHWKNIFKKYLSLFKDEQNNLPFENVFIFRDFDAFLEHILESYYINYENMSRTLYDLSKEKEFELVLYEIESFIKKYKNNEKYNIFRFEYFSDNGDEISSKLRFINVFQNLDYLEIDNS